MQSVYSFSDVTLVMSHPNVGKFTFTGQGLGSITVSRSNDLSQHDVAADGSVMTSKIITKNGTLALAIQQTSAAQKFLKRWLDYLIVAPTREWAQTSAVLYDAASGDSIVLNGIAPQKRADVTYQNSGQQATWNLLAAEIIG